MKTICLNMIVKNESAVIEKTLTNILHYIPIHHWIISDTGSTDSTPTIIQDFFSAKNIPGELFHHEWKNFGHNRSLALECAFNKTDYVLVFDADDSIHGQFKLPVLQAEWYMLQFGQDFTYNRPLLFTNRKPWKYQGVLHEFLKCLEPISNPVVLKGNYYIESGRTGFRSQDSDKYIKDALILEQAFQDEPPNGLQGRYAFYCAQSYRDAKNIDKAIEWYKKVLTIPNHWNQEYYYSSFQLGCLYNQQNQKDNAVYYWLKTVEYDSERMEGVVSAIQHFYAQQNHILVNALYHKFKQYKIVENKLFLHLNLYHDRIEYYNSISAYYVNDKESGYECCKKVFLSAKISPTEMDATIKNLIVYKDLLLQDGRNKFIFQKLNTFPKPWSTNIEQLYKLKNK
jgi:glycosyltransferase involved in cell wall biosynthesis